MQTCTGVLSALFYRAYEYMLRGNLDKMTMFYHLLEREFQRCENKEVFQEFFNEDRAPDLKLIKKQVNSQTLFEEFIPFEPIEHPIKMSETEIEEEKQLVNHVARNMELLHPFFPNLKLKDIEHPCGPDRQDKCDMVAIDDTQILYPIEFKLNKATHAVVGQIGKYSLHFKLRLSYRLYRKVHGVVIANSYSKYAINELKKRGYTCLVYSGNLDKLKFTQV
jgi:hypothetical protein